MEKSAEDLIFYAETMHKCGRHNEAINALTDLTSVKPEFSREDYHHFTTIYKAAIDPIRQLLRDIDESWDEAPESCRKDVLDRLHEERNKGLENLSKICNSAITLIKEKLLPAASTNQLQALWNKAIGDYFRYIAESAEEQEAISATENANKHYKQAVELASTLENHKSHPTFLICTLNYAIFMFEQLREMEEAAGLLQNTVREAEPGIDALESSEKNVALSLLETIRKNLAVWSSDPTDENYI